MKMLRQFQCGGIALVLALVLVMVGTLTLFFFGTNNSKSPSEISSQSPGKAAVTMVKSSPFINNAAAYHIDRAVPANYDWLCDNLFLTEEFKNYDFSAEYQKRYPELVKKIKSIPEATREGSSGTLKQQALMLHLIAQDPNVKTICETGFNVGFSSFTYLAADPDVIVHSFDIGRNPGTKPMAEYLRSIYGGRLNVHYSDSRETIWEFHQANPSFKCDFIFVDGGHSDKVPWSDIQTFALMAVPGKSIMMFNDYSAYWVMQTTHPELDGAWELASNYRLVKEMFRCNFKYSLLFKKHSVMDNMAIFLRKAGEIHENYEDTYVRWAAEESP